MLRRDFQRLSVVRVREARSLARAGMWDGAYYFGGFAVECALKSCVARATERYEFPDRSRANRAYTHKLEELLQLAGLAGQLRATTPAVQDAWARIKDWNIETRYHVGKSEDEVRQFLRSIDGRMGVLPWLKRFW